MNAEQSNLVSRSVRKIDMTEDMEKKLLESPQYLSDFTKLIGTKSLRKRYKI